MDPKVRCSNHSGPKNLKVFKVSKLDHIFTVQRVAINNHWKSLRHGNACCNPSNWGQGAREAARSRITAQTNVSLEHCLFELMKDEKYQTIHMSHVGSILQITSIQMNLFKVYLHFNLNKRSLTTSSNNGSWHNDTRLQWIMGQQQYATLQRTAASLRGHKHCIDFVRISYACRSDFPYLILTVV
jgi:hypothetical protein